MYERNGGPYPQRTRGLSQAGVFWLRQGNSIRDAEESVPVGSKEPPAVVSRPVCSWLFKPTSNLSLDTSDCLEAVPIPEKHAAPFARLLS